MKIEVLRLDDPDVKPVLVRVEASEARENLRVALEASEKLRDYIENREGPLFPQDELR